MPNFGRVYREYLDTIKSDLIVEIKNQKRSASGSLIRSFRVVANQFLQGELRSNSYIEFLEDGVGSQPGKIGANLINNIISWMQSRGISPLRRGKIQQGTAVNMRRAAGAIAQSLVQKGTAIKRGERGLDLQTPIKENMPKLLKDMGAIMVTTFTDNLRIRK